MHQKSPIEWQGEQVLPAELQCQQELKANPIGEETEKHLHVQVSIQIPH